MKMSRNHFGHKTSRLDIQILTDPMAALNFQTFFRNIPSIDKSSEFFRKSSSETLDLMTAQCISCHIHESRRIFSLPKQNFVYLTIEIGTL